MAMGNEMDTQPDTSAETEETEQEMTTRVQRTMSGGAAMPPPSEIALVDLSFVFRKHWHSTAHEELGEAHSRTMEEVLKISNAHKWVGICIDRPPYKRTEVYPEYKGQREKASEVMVGQLKGVISKLEREGYPIFGRDGFEADDMIASVCAELYQQPITIYSGDKDLLQLVDGRVRVKLSGNEAPIIDDFGVIEKFGVKAKQIPDFLALWGDASDNIKGAPGIGKVKASGYLREYGTLEAILEEISTAVANGTDIAKDYKSIHESTELLFRNRKLIRLARLKVDCSALMQPRTPQSLATKMSEDLVAQQQRVASEEAMEEEDQPTAIVRATEAARADVRSPWAMQLEPSTFQQAAKTAEILMESRLFPQFQSPQAVLAVVMTGRSMGIDAVASLRGFNIIKGKVSPTSQMLIGLVKRSPTCQYFRLVNTTPEQATWETMRRGEPEPTSLTYTIEDANQAGLTGNDNWRKRPKTMLRWRCSTELARAVYPDITAGLYTQDDASEMD